MLESSELIWLEFYHTCGNVVRLEALAKLLLGDLSSIIGTSILVRLPPVLCYALELAERKKAPSHGHHTELCPIVAPQL